MNSNKRINYKKFYEGVIQIWNNYQKTGKKSVSTAIAKQYCLPNCKLDYFEPLFELTEEPTFDQAISIRNRISALTKRTRMKKALHEPSDMSKYSIDAILTELERRGYTGHIEKIEKEEHDF